MKLASHTSTLCCTAMLLLLTVSVQAQDSLQTTQLSEVRKNNYQVELGLSSFSGFLHGTAGASVLLKRKINFGKLIEVNSLRFVRGFFTANTQITFTDDPSLKDGDTTQILYHPSDEVNFTIGLGMEKQNKGKFFVHYRGVDVFSQFYKTDDDVFNGSFGGVTVNTVGTTDRYIQTIKLGIIPFIGAKYYLTSQLSVGLEAGLQIAWFHTKFTEVGFENKLVNGIYQNVFVEEEPFKSNGIDVTIRGVRFVTFGYTF